MPDPVDVPQPAPGDAVAANSGAAVAATSAAIGHELNNLMTVILAALDQLRLRAEAGARDPEREARLLARAELGAQRAAGLASRLLALADAATSSDQS